MELEEIAKINSQAMEIDDEEGSEATKALMPNYGATPAQRGLTPARTPVARTPTAENRIRMEAENVCFFFSFVLLLLFLLLLYTFLVLF